MDKITISNGVTTITMPRTKDITVNDDELSKEILMASGKLVKEMIGYRAVVTAKWDYVPVATITALQTMLRAGGWFTVGYPDPDGTDKSITMSVSMPAYKVFKFVGTTPMWHDVSLTMTAQEVS